MLQRCSSRVFALLGAIAVCGGLAHASVLYNNTITLLSTDPTQLGRLSRNGVPQDWSFQESFPGVLNPTTSYHYEAIPVFVPHGLPFLQISIDSDNINTFGSAYDTSYNPDSGPLPFLGFDVNYLGDAGTSGNFFGSPLFFQVFEPTAAASLSGGTVIVVLNETTTNGLGLNSPIGVLVEGFSDTAFDGVVPEPVTFALLGAGLLLVAARYRAVHRVL